jgi:hypothetical protein
MFLGILMPSVISVHFSQLVDQSVTYAHTSLHYQTYSCQDISQVSWGDTNGEVVDHECNLGSTQNRVSDTITHVTLNIINDVMTLHDVDQCEDLVAKF